MNELFLGLTNTLKGPQIPLGFNFKTRCDVFIDRYGKMYAADNKALKLSNLSTSGMVYIYFMGIAKNTLTGTWTIQQWLTLKSIFFHLDQPHIIFSDDYASVKKVGEYDLKPRT